MPNPSPDRRVDDVHDLARRVCDGVISGADRERLEGLLREDRDARRAYLEYLRVDAGLAWRYRTGDGQRPTDGGADDAKVTPHQRPGAGRGAARKLAVWAAFVVTTAATVAFIALRPDAAPTDENQTANVAAADVEFIATLKDSTAAVWREQADPLDVGGRIAAGPLRMEAGTVDLILDSGVRLLVEGPADLSLRSADEAFLLSGKVAVHVPEHAIGFTLSTPTSTLIDQGTEFGVVAEDSGATEVHVFKGRVDLVYDADAKSESPSQRISVLDRQARRVSEAGTEGEGVAFSPQTFRGLATQIAEPIVWPVSEGGNGHYYQLVIHSAPISWQHAAVDAFNRHHRGQAGHLVTVTSEEEHRFVVENLLKDSPEISAWMGLTDVLREGYFRWVTGEPVVFERWGRTQPDNFLEFDGHGGEDYGMYTKLEDQPWGWNDLSNDSMHQSVWASLIEYEPAAGARRDWSIETEPIGWTREIGGQGQHYRLVLSLQPLSWDEAALRASETSHLGTPGHLATFDSPEEREFVVDKILRICGVAENLIGLVSDNESGELRWITGQPASVEPYAEPNIPTDRVYGQMRWLDAGWRLQTVSTDRRPAGWFGYLIEYPEQDKERP